MIAWKMMIAIKKVILMYVVVLITGQITQLKRIIIVQTIKMKKKKMKKKIKKNIAMYASQMKD